MPHRNTFYLLNQRVGWREMLPPAPGAALALPPLPGSARPLADAQGGFGGLALPSALALDCAGQIYILDGDRIQRYDPCVGCFETLAHIGGHGCRPRQFDHPSGMAISCRDDLYIVDRGNRRVQVFSIKGLALRSIRGPFRVEADSAGGTGGAGWRVHPVSAGRSAAAGCLSGEQSVYPPAAWDPVDIAVDPAGRSFVSDTANGLVHVFSPAGRWQAAWDGRDENGVALQTPTHLALDRRGWLYVVQDGLPEVVVLDQTGRFAGRVGLPDEIKDHFIPAAIGFDPQGRLHLADLRSGCIYIYDESQSGACACRTPARSPCAVAFDPQGCLLLADRLGKLVYSLEPAVAYAGSAVFIAGPLDSERFRCTWHRVELHGTIEPGTTVQVETFTSEAPKAPAEIQFMPADRWATRQVNGAPGQGGWDCLVRSQPGRYLWLRLTLRGDGGPGAAGSHTPQVDSIRVEYPRASSLQHLPAVFRQDAASADFLDRFLSLMDRAWEGLGDTIEHGAWLYDSQSTPAVSDRPGGIDFLTWLASWMGLALEQHWPEAHRRLLVEQAHRLYALRGTPAGLRLHIAIYTGVEPQIVEHFKLRRWLVVNQARLGDASVLWGADVVDRLQLDEHARIGDFVLQDSGDPQRDPFHTHAHQFSVYVLFPGAGELQMRTLERILEQSKPAHTQGSLVMVEPRLRIGRQSIVGVSTVVGCYPSGVQLDGGQGGDGTRLNQGILGPSEDEGMPPRLRVGKGTRLGSGTAID